MNANDIRELEDMNPIPEELGGNAYLVPLNTAPLSLVATGQLSLQGPSGVRRNGDVLDAEFYETQLLPDKADREKRANKLLTTRRNTVENFVPLFRDAIQRIVNKETKALQGVVQKVWTERQAIINPKRDFDEWFDAFYDEFPEYVKKIIKPVSTSFTASVFGIAGQEVGLGPGMLPELEDFLDEYMNTFATRYVGSSRGQIVKLLKETPPEEIAEILVKRANEWMEKRAKKVAEDEAVRQSNAIALETYKRAGVMYKGWRAQPGACPFCRALDTKYGSRIPIDALFGQEGGQLYPMEESDVGGYHIGAATFMEIKGPKAHPPIHRGCKCSVIPIFE